MAEPGSIDRLNDGERQILRPRVAGHTAKSIAGTLDLSVNAVNERLREARRKTGAASSRELARLLHAQENGDKQIGVAGASYSHAQPGSPGELMMSRWLNHRSAVAMILVAAAAAIGALTLGQPASPSSQADGNIRSQPHSLAELKRNDAERERRFANEAVDAAWAPEAERQTHEALAANKHLAVDDVQCATSMCRVKAKLARSDDNEPMMMFGPGLMKTLRAEGARFSSVSASVKSRVGEGSPDGVSPDPQPVVIWLSRNVRS